MGSITALAIFILAKAGVLIISNPAPNGASRLSPFFISFLGIVSGLMADQALDTIQRTGNNWFAKSGSRGLERWGFGLADAFDSMELDDAEVRQQKEKLADMLGTSSGALEGWINEERAVLWREQELMAAFLRRPARELFSDMQKGLPVSEPLPLVLR